MMDTTGRQAPASPAALPIPETSGKATPDAVIELPLGAPGEIVFDEQDNLVVQDHTWCRLWIINYAKDPSWLHLLP